MRASVLPKQASRPVTREYSGIPGWLYVPAVIGGAFILVPLIAMGTRIEWSNFWSLITSPSSRTALILSLQTVSVSTLLCIVFGVPMAIVLARGSFRGQTLLRSLVLLPMVLPPVVGGIALLYTFGRRGLIGRYLEVFGMNIAFSTTAVDLAQTFVALPFLVVSLEGTLRTYGRKYEVVAATLGASPSVALRQVTLPLVVPGLVSAAILSFARALGEFGATITFAGSLEGVTRTLPLEIYLQRVKDPQAAIALSLLLVVVSVLVTAATTAISRRSQR